ncbi:MAG: 3-deoxy-D-manno-octulosonic acid transferase [Pirellulales bacterium]|nr:3-deoxy-D-manno-octulosonic acid transferase [Pirellulales bacterium]
MSYLLNIAYLLLLLIFSPWLIVQAVRKGKYREGYAEKLLGLAPRQTANKTQSALTPDPSPASGRGEITQSALAPGPSSASGRGENTQRRLWLHAVSVGEVNLLAPLLKAIEEKRPDWECVVSTTTMTGMELAKKKYPNNTVFYCPLDFTWAVKNAVRRVRPDVLVLAELELWPNLIGAAKRAGAKVAVVNGRLGEKSFRGYRRIRPLLAHIMRKIDLIAAQDETYAERFRALGARAEAVHVTGSMKYDGARTDRANPATRRLADLAGFAEDDIVLLAGSTQEPEEEMALETFRELSARWPKLRLILVPRHPDRFDAVARLLDSSGLPWQRRTDLRGERRGERGVGRVRSTEKHKIITASHQQEIKHQQSENTRSPPLTPLPSPLSSRVLLVDVVGELGAWWGAAHIAFVGGSMGSRGGQNMIEPAAYGAAVSFGPNTWNFRDVAAAMLAREAAVVVRNRNEFAGFVRRCLEEPDYAAELGRRGQSFVLSQLGATERTLALLKETLSRA